MLYQEVSAVSLYRVSFMINFGWGDYDQTYSVLSFEGHWTTQDFASTISSMYHELKTEAHSIDLLVDLRHSGVPPTSIMGLASRVIKGQSASSFGRIIIISNTFIWKRLYEAVIHTHNAPLIDVYFVDNVDKAYQLLISETKIS